MSELKIKYIGDKSYKTYKKVKSHSIIGNSLLWIKNDKEEEFYIPLFNVAIFLIR